MHAFSSSISVFKNVSVGLKPVLNAVPSLFCRDKTKSGAGFNQTENLRNPHVTGERY